MTVTGLSCVALGDYKDGEGEGRDLVLTGRSLAPHTMRPHNTLRDNSCSYGHLNLTWTLTSRYVSY